MQAAAFAGLALLSTDFSLPPVIALAALAGTLATCGRTLTRAAAAAVLTPRGLLREGNALLNIGFTVTAAAGPALAGVVVATAGRDGAVRRRGLLRRRGAPTRHRHQPAPRQAGGRRLGHAAAAGG